MKRNFKIFLISAFVFITSSFSVSAQDDAEVKKANGMMQQAGMRLLVHKDYDAALELYGQASGIFRVQYGQDSRKFLEALKGMADCYDGTGNSEMAIRYYRRILTSNDMWMTDYACLKLGRLYLDGGNVDAAIDAYGIGVSRYRNGNGVWNQTYYNIFKELFRLDYAEGNLSEAIQVGKELCDNIRDDRPRWISLSTDLAAVYEESGNHAEALRLYHEILSVYSGRSHESETVIQRTNIAMTYHGIGGIYKDLGNYTQAIEYLSQACERYRSLGLYSDMRYFTVLVQLSVCHSALRNRDSAIGYAHEAYSEAMKSDMDIADKVAGMANYAAVLAEFGEYDKAFSLLEDSMKTSLDDKSKSLIYHCMVSISNDPSAALEFARQAALLDENPVNLHNLAVTYAERRMYDEAAVPLARGWEMAVNEMRSYFMQSRENEYKFIWDKYKLLIKEPVHLTWQTDNADIVRYAYNSVLMTKSIQLSSSTAFRNALENSSDEGLKNLYRRWMNTPEDSPEYSRIEMELLSALRAEDAYADAFGVRWNDVRDGLKKGEVAVEFTHIVRSDTGEKAYLALVLTRDSDAPESVFLSIDGSVERLGSSYDVNDLYNSSEAGNMVWGEVLSAARKTCSNIEIIYFVPDGVLYSIPIEYMVSEGQRMNERYTMRRLTSTREILNLDDGAFGNRSAALFGGIDYSITVEDMEYYAYTMSREVSLNSSWAYLPGTKDEVESIDRILGEDYSIDIHSGPSCIEESFMQYSGHSPAIIHVATHGFYLPVEGGLSADEDAALKRCGLAFAGANQTILGGHNIPVGVEDGILSAAEIATMDLTDTDLVVLSACQSGLGDVDDEGVFGLQRAFKKAGAGSMLMSLWSVDDAVTGMLMVEFYKGLIRGLSKHEALADAQRHIRRSSYTDAAGAECSMDDPYYWAPFVIVE